MDTTIVIVNWNGGDLIQKCLRSIRESRQSFTVKVIVVDNDSRDGSREAASAAFPEFSVINSGSNLGFGRANNLARTMVDTPLVLFLNPDTELKPDTVEKAVQCLRDDPKIGIVGCKMLYPSGEVQEQGLQWYPSPWTILLDSFLNNRLTRRWLPTMDPRRSSEVRKLYGGFLLCRKEVLDAASWFDDRYFMYAEDVDLSRTVRDLGWKLFYSADAEIIHDHGGSSNKAPGGFSILMKNRSIDQYLLKYQGMTGAFLARLVVLFSSLARIVVLLVSGLIPGLFRGPGRDRWRAALFKQKLMLRWSLGLKQATIPGSVAANDSPGSGVPVKSAS